MGYETFALGAFFFPPASFSTVFLFWEEAIIWGTFALHGRRLPLGFGIHWDWEGKRGYGFSG